MRHIRSRTTASALIFVCLMSFFGAPVLAQETTHVIQPGETLFRIATNYGVDINLLAQVNGIINPTLIYAGQTLIIPGEHLPEPSVELPAQPEAPAVESQTVESAAPATPVTHIVQRGENLANIATRYGMTMEYLAHINGIINPNLIYAGQTLLVTPLVVPETPAVPESAPVEVAAAVPDRASVEAAPGTAQPQGEIMHVVQPGEQLGVIGRRYGVSWLAIAQLNNIFNPDQIYAGQTLRIPANSATPDFGIVVSSGVQDAPAAPAPYLGTGKEILVDLSDQRVYAYENGVLLRNVLVSTGLPYTPTVQGQFSVERKYIAQLMTGPGYYLPDVPYIMYFYQGYALHGTYWHNNFGQPMSHGCVNMPTPEAEWFYNWTEIGTPVKVQI